jgi:hypothetical protein
MSDKIKGGYYLKAKCVQESWIAKAPPHIREIWDLFIRKAFYQDGYSLKKGQLIITYSEIIEELAWFIGYRKMTYKKHHCEIAMKALLKENMIATTKTTKGVLITIVNYCKYQDIKNYESYTKQTTNTTGTLQPTDTIEKEIKEVKEETKTDTGFKPCPHQEIVSLYNTTLPELPSVKPKLWNGQRSTNLQARWKEDEERQDIEWWKNLFIQISGSDFLTGRIKSDRPWRADLGWIVEKKNLVKIIEGKYDGGKKYDKNGWQIND